MRIFRKQSLNTRQMPQPTARHFTFMLICLFVSHLSSKKGAYVPWWRCVGHCVSITLTFCFLCGLRTLFAVSINFYGHKPKKWNKQKASNTISVWCDSFSDEYLNVGWWLRGLERRPIFNHLFFCFFFAWFHTVVADAFCVGWIWMW